LIFANRWRKFGGKSGEIAAGVCPMRRPIIAGNWKLHGKRAEARELVREVVKNCRDVTEVDIVVCPTFTSLDAVSQIIHETNVALGAQNCYFEEKGAYTGEISPGMLKELDCAYCIIGHSERRQFFGETDEGVSKKAHSLHQAGITPIVCVGELLEERQAGKTMDVILGQLRAGLCELTAEQIVRTVIAYEPVWAIGTGMTATPAQAQEVHAAIRAELVALFGPVAANAVRIQYGGSVKPDNVQELMAQPDIDGALVGGASLRADSFCALVKFQE
jgi:triosephosphate isomerase